MANTDIPFPSTPRKPETISVDTQKTGDPNFGGSVIGNFPYDRY